ASAGLEPVDPLELLRPDDRVRRDVPLPAPDVRDPLGFREERLAPLQRFLGAPPLGELAGELLRPLLDTPLQAAPGLVDLRVALLDLPEHRVERGDEEPDLVAPRRIRADRVVLPRRDDAGDAREAEDRRGDRALETGRDEDGDGERGEG